MAIGIRDTINLLDSFSVEVYQYGNTIFIGERVFYIQFSSTYKTYRFAIT